MTTRKVRELCNEVDGEFGSHHSVTGDETWQDTCKFESGGQTALVKSDGQLVDVETSVRGAESGQMTRIDGNLEYDIRYDGVTVTTDESTHGFTHIGSGPGELR